ncbi:hypothetical protein V2J09_022316 [Rumex salicifolius]
MKVKVKARMERERHARWEIVRGLGRSPLSQSRVRTELSWKKLKLILSTILPLFFFDILRQPYRSSKPHKVEPVLVLWRATEEGKNRATKV